MTESTKTLTLEQQLAEIAYVAPALVRHLETTIFETVWNRPALALRDRSLVTLAAVVATAKDWETAVYLGRALDSGITPLEISEILLQLACYTGWPNAVKAAMDMKAVYDARGIGVVVESTDPLLALEPEAEATRKTTVDTNVSPTAPALANDTNDILFAEIWRRPGQSARDRSIVTMTALIAIGQPEQLSFHANRAMDNGLTAAEAGEILSQLAYYVGWPRAMSAVPVLEKIIADRQKA